MDSNDEPKKFPIQTGLTREEKIEYFLCCMSVIAKIVQSFIK